MASTLLHVSPGSHSPNFSRSVVIVAQLRNIPLIQFCYEYVFYLVSAHHLQNGVAIALQMHEQLIPHIAL